MERYLQTEWLDGLPVEDPGAKGSRRDLERLNAWMGNARTVARELHQVLNSGTPRIAELGAGDGRFMRRVGRCLGARGSGGTLLLLDRQASVPPEAIGEFRDFGWKLETRQLDVFDWLEQPSEGAWDAWVANLFLHHFTEAQLTRLLSAAAHQTRAFISVEPFRSGPALMFSKLVRFIGCNHVTQHDAPISVRAGFKGKELSALWPTTRGWRLHEAQDGLFSHLFVAERIGSR